MQPKPSKQFGSLFTVLALVVTMLGVPPVPAYAGAPAPADFTLNSLSTPITTITRVSVDSSGNQGDYRSYIPSISGDGRYVAFYSMADNLVSGDTNGTPDAFLRDTQLNITTLISVDSSGVQGNSWSYDQTNPPFVSADGRYVVFRSLSTNLISGVTTNGTYHIFLRDTKLNTTTLVSVDSSGAEGDDQSYSPSISADGRYVTFSSDADNLVSGDTNHSTDIFRRDTQASTTTRLSVASNGTQGNAQSYSPFISSDGHFVVYYSMASNLVNADTNGVWDIFRRDTQTNTTTRISVASDGTQANDGSDFPSISADGRYVAFSSTASNLVNGDTNGTNDVFVRDTQSAATTRLSVNSSGTQGNDWSDIPSISADGRFVVFRSIATNLVSGDTNNAYDVFLRDTLTGTTTRPSVGSYGAQGNDWSAFPSISADGRYVAFYSNASNLVGGDTNGMWDVFIAPSINLFTNRIYLPMVIR